MSVKKPRVRSYFQPKGCSCRQNQGFGWTSAPTWTIIVTDSEVEALILGSRTWIKEHRPRYNVLLKDDKSYPYLKVTLGDDEITPG